MKKISCLPILLAFTMSLASCDALRTVGRHPEAIKNYFFDDGAPADDSREVEASVETFYDTETAVTDKEALTEHETSELMTQITEIEGDLEFYAFDNGNAAVVYSEKGAWIIDYIENRAVSVFDFSEILAVTDVKGEGGEYFKEPRLSMSFEELGKELKLIYSVTSETEGAELKAYAFFTYDPVAGLQRGFRGYYPDIAVYPGSYDPATIYNIAEYEALGIDEDTYIYKVASALASGDIEKLSEVLYLDPRVTEAWKGVKIGEYSISRTDFSANWYPELTVFLDITESPLEKLPAGKYNVRIGEGYSAADFVFERLDGESKKETYDTSDIKTPIGFIYAFASNFGGGYHPDEQNPDNASWAHSILDLYTVISAQDGGLPEYERFKEFLLYRFGIEDAASICGEKDFYNHGGHGLSVSLCEVSNYFAASGVHEITVDFFADPMRTVIAYTQVYTLVENNGTFQLDKVERTYDSGMMPNGWTL